MGFFINFRSLIIYLVLATSYIAIGKAQCYYPGGAWAKDQFPCDKYAYTTLCCPTGWTCFSNNLCLATDPNVVSSDLPLGTAIRGTCTNPLWNNTVCGDFCLNDPVSSNNGSVVPCGSNKWCCQPDSADGKCDCNSGKGTFQVSDGTAQTIIGVVGLQHTSTASIGVPRSSAQNPSAASTRSMSPTVSVMPSSKSSTTSLPTSMSSSSSRSSSIATSGAVKSGSSTTSASPTSTRSASTATSTNQQILDTSTPLTQTTAFRAGVGAAAGIVSVVVAGVVIWLFVRWLRRRGRNNDAFRGGKWVQDPISSDVPFQVAPVPHPYGGSQFSTSQSRGSLADQISHNRRTPGPIDIAEEQNPYSNRYMTGGTGS